MRNTLYRVLVAAPSKIASGTCSLLGAVGTIWPAWVQAKVGGKMIPANIQATGIGILVLALVYFFLLWRLKPEGWTSSAPGNIVSFPQSPIIGDNYGHINIGGTHLGAAPTAHSEPDDREAFPTNELTQKRARLPPEQVEGPTNASSNRADMPFAEAAQRVFDSMAPNPSEVEDKRALMEGMALKMMDEIVHRPLAVWGRRGKLAIEKISPDFLKGAEMKIGKGVIIGIAAPYAMHSTTYADIKFVRSEVDAIWPNNEQV